MPESMGGHGGAGTNPEQLFAAGYSACFANAMRSSATPRRQPRGRRTARPSPPTSTSARSARAASASPSELDVKVPGLAQDAAEELVAKAHERCPYSNATRGNIEVDLAVEGSGG